MWRDIGVAEKDIQPDWQKITQAFMQQARQGLGYQAFVAEVEGAVVGSASCQLYAGLYPAILSEQYRKYGYIWGVYVEPADRKRGIATRLTQMSVDYLKSLGCTRVLLNAAPKGRSVYQNLGFADGNTMGLDL
ncbi:GNAT family N-acetyltransferase [Vasconcelosia minhoensis]|nr:GNAT family N-acetyltransferase [Romeria gracilis]